ncbi:MAG: signal peptidase I [Candidatus Saccharimonadales bacterium]
MDENNNVAVPPPLTPEAETQPLPAAPDSTPEQKPSKEGLKSIISTISLLLLAPIIALLLTAFVFQSYQVDGPSMQTTLQNNDRLIVVKVARSWARLTHHNYIPNRGDVIIFNRADVSGPGESSRQLIKRVTGLPGDRVVVKDGTLTVYNLEHAEGFSPDKTMPYGSVIGETAGNVDLIVPAGEVFVSGDNRGNSLDSRYFGTVPANDIVGKLGLRVYPFNQAKLF